MYQVTRIAAALSLLFPASVLAQSIEGVVQDSTGKPVANASVKVKGTGSEAVTDKDGRFLLRDLKTGKRELHISAAGYAHLFHDVQVVDDTTQQVALTLSYSPIEVIDVVASPVHMSTMESAAPVTVLAGDTLRRQQASTLGDTLEKVTGVHTNFHGGVASTPIIRGLGGPRVMIAQNGLDVGDVSRVGPDHSVATEASTSQQIEVLRGPATLFYGSGAIGGVVNVVDSRVPTDTVTRGEWLLEGNSADERKLGSFNFTTGTDNVGLYLDGYWRETDDYEVPVAPDVHEPLSSERTVANTAEESNGFTIGTSYLFDRGYVGVAIEQFNREYGIPGHTHGDADGHDHGDEEQVYADLDQTRVQILSEINVDSQWISTINARAALTDYEHAEIEAGLVGTTFENETQELRLDVMHQPFAGWSGGLSFQYKASDVTAQGSEAFTPPSEARTFAMALMEEKHFGDFLVQMGGRVERVTLDADAVLLPPLEVHSHDAGAGHSAHGDGVIRVFDVSQEFTPVSVSAGVVWDFTPGYNIGLSLSRSERAPSASELLSFGPHIGTGTYEVGALFDVHEHDGHFDFGLTERTIDLETANNIDLTFRKTQGDVGFVFNAFYNQVDNYYYQVNTGLYAEAGHDHDHGDAHDHDHASELPVYLFRTDDVVLHGFEAQVAWQVTRDFKATIFSDYVRARLQDGGDLPRTPPLRFGTQFSYEAQALSAHLDVIRYQEQDKVAATETTTDGYTMVDASVAYNFTLLDQSMAVYLKGQNLTDTEARVHTSFLKDIAPRAGRSFAIGLRGYF